MNALNRFRNKKKTTKNATRKSLSKRKIRLTDFLCAKDSYYFFDYVKVTSFLKKYYYKYFYIVYYYNQLLLYK